MLKAGEITLGRSREGAWIEMIVAIARPFSVQSRSREGAWIEMASRLSYAEC